MTYVPLGGTLVAVGSPAPVSERQYFPLRPILQGTYGIHSAAHVGRRKKLLGVPLTADEASLSYLLSLGIFSLQETGHRADIKVDLSSWPGEKKLEASSLSHLLEKYMGYLSRDGIQVRTINGFPLHSHYESSLEQDLAVIFADRLEVAGYVLQAVGDEVSSLQQITTKSMAGLHGGVVGKYRRIDGTSVVFKVETDFRAAYKSTQIPFLIHQHAAQNQLAALLAKRIPKPLAAFPIQQGSYWISLAEDFSGRVIPASKDDLRIMRLGLQRGLDYTVVEALYLSALYQEVVGSILQKQPDPVLLMESCISSNLSEDEMRSRLGYDKEIFKQIRPSVESLLARMPSRNEYLAEMALGDRQAVHGDFKSVHRVDGIILDTGSSRYDTVAVDLGRVFMDQPAVFTSDGTFFSYLDSFVHMRRQLNPNYDGPPLLATTTAFQTMNDALRNLGWEVQQGEHHTISRYLSVLEKINELALFRSGD